MWHNTPIQKGTQHEKRYYRLNQVQIEVSNRLWQQNDAPHNIKEHYITQYITIHTMIHTFFAWEEMLVFAIYFL